MRAMIQFAMLATSMLNMAEAQPGLFNPALTECLYCKNMDTSSGFLYSFSYCKDTKICVADAWTKLNMWCAGGWTEGYMLDIDEDCNT